MKIFKDSSLKVYEMCVQPFVVDRQDKKTFFLQKWRRDIFITIFHRN